MPDAVEILQQGIDAIKDRAASRDTETERSMAKTVQLFNTLYGKDLTESQGWMFMALLKMVRASQGAFRLDDYVDMGPYCAFAGEAASKEAGINSVDQFSCSFPHKGPKSNEQRIREKMEHLQRELNRLGL